MLECDTWFDWNSNFEWMKIVKSVTTGKHIIERRTKLCQQKHWLCFYVCDCVCRGSFLVVSIFPEYSLHSVSKVGWTSSAPICLRISIKTRQMLRYNVLSECRKLEKNCVFGKYYQVFAHIAKHIFTPCIRVIRLKCEAFSLH